MKCFFGSRVHQSSGLSEPGALEKEVFNCFEGYVTECAERLFLKVAESQGLFVIKTDECQSVESGNRCLLSNRFLIKSDITDVEHRI